MAKRKQFTEAQLYDKGYLPAVEAANALHSMADMLAHRADWVKLSLQLWYQMPEGWAVDSAVQAVSVTLVSGKD